MPIMLAMIVVLISPQAKRDDYGVALSHLNIGLSGCESHYTPSCTSRSG